MGDNTGKEEAVKMVPAPSSGFQQLIDWDVDITRKMAVCASPNSSWGNWRPLMRFLEYSAHGVPWLIGNLAVILASHHLHFQQIYLNLLYGLFVDLFIVTVIKAIFRRPRPAHNVIGDLMTVSVDFYSFPSGHTTRAIFVAFFFVEHLSYGCLFDAFMIFWGIAVSLSRVLLGRHHVLDISVGAVIGVLQYRLLADHLWLSEQTCQGIIQPMQEKFHI